MATFLYVTEADLSLDNGEGINEREFVQALLTRYADEVVCVAPAPRRPANFHHPGVAYAPPVRRSNPVAYAYHMLGLWRLIRRLEREHEFAAIVFRLGAIPLVPLLRTLQPGPPVILKYLGGNPETGTAKMRALSLIRTPLYRLITRRVAAADTPSSVLADWARENLDVPAHRLEVIPFGANVDAFRVVSPGEWTDRFGLERFSRLIVYVGEMASIRHVDLLIEGFAALVREDQRRSLGLLLVGEGAELDQLESLAERLGVRDNVVFTGPVAYRDVPGLMSACDVAVDLSRVDIPLEGGQRWASYSQKIAQYLAAGLPVVAWDIEDNRFIAENDLGGLVPVLDEAALPRVLRRALEAAESCEDAWADRIRRYAETHLSQIGLAGRRVGMWRRVTGRPE